MRDILVPCTSRKKSYAWKGIPYIFLQIPHSSQGFAEVAFLGIKHETVISQRCLDINP